MAGLKLFAGKATPVSTALAARKTILADREKGASTVRPAAPPPVSEPAPPPSSPKPFGNWTAPSKPAASDKPSIGRPMLLAILASLAWGSFIAVAYASPAMAGYAAAGLGPIAFFFVAAHLRRRADDMRLVARSVEQIAAQLQAPESAAQDKIAGLSQAVMREVAAMDAGLQTAVMRAEEVSARVRTEVVNLDLTYSENVRRLQSLLDALAGEREAMTADCERIHAGIVEAKSGLARDLNSVTDHMGAGVSEAIAQIAAVFSAREAQFADALEDARGALGRNIDLHGAKAVEAIAGMGEETVVRLTQVSAGLHDTFSTRIHAAVEDLSGGIASRGDELVERVVQAGDRIHELMSAQGPRLAQELTGTGEKFAELLTSRTRASETIIEGAGSALVGKLDAHREEVRAQIEAHGAGARAAIDALAQRLVDEFAARGDRLNARIASITDGAVSALGTQGEALSATVREHVEAITGALAGGTQLVDAAFNERLAEVARSVDAQRTLLADTLTEREHGISATLVEHSDSLNKTLSGWSAYLESTFRIHSEALSDHAKGFNHRFDSGSAHALKSLMATSDRLLEDLSARLNGFEEVILTNGGALTERLSRDADYFLSVVNARLDNLEGSLGSKATEFHQRVSESAGALSSTLATGAERIDGLVLQHVDTITSAMERQGATASQLLNQRAAQIAASFGTNHAAMDQALAARIAFMETMLAKYNAALAERSGQIDEKVGANLAKAVAAIGQQTDYVLSTLTERLGQFEQVIYTDGGELVERVAAHARHFNEGVNVNLQSVEATFGARSQDFHARMAEQGDLAADKLNQQIVLFDYRTSSKAEEVSAALEALLGRIHSGLDARAAMLNETLARRALELARVMVAAGLPVARPPADAPAAAPAAPAEPDEPKSAGAAP